MEELRENKPPVSIISAVDEPLINRNMKPHIENNVYCTVRVSSKPLIKLDDSYVVRVSTECFRCFCNDLCVNCVLVTYSAHFTILTNDVQSFYTFAAVPVCCR